MSCGASLFFSSLSTYLDGGLRYLFTGLDVTVEAVVGPIEDEVKVILAELITFGAVLPVAAAALDFISLDLGSNFFSAYFFNISSASYWL